jgi:branched-chain amino acid transport system ATP-binding protein
VTGASTVASPEGLADVPAVAIENLGKRFGGVVAVSDVTFALSDETITGLIGPNGAGKTTLLNLITGYLKPTSGSIAIKGKTVTGWLPHAVAGMGVARTYQNILLLDSETVATNILIGCHGALQRRRLVTRAKEWRSRPGRDVVERLLTVLNLREVAKDEVAQLPYGMRRRVEIARALAASPSLLILDEPTAGMTRDESDEIGRLVQQVRDAGTTVLLVEHNVRLVRAICDEVLVLQWGNIIARDSAERVWDDPVVRTAYLGDMEGQESETGPAKQEGGTTNAGA